MSVSLECDVPRAIHRQQRVIEAAARLFSSDGYARTTMARIAAEAGVAAETVQGQGPKAALMIAAAEYVAFGVSGRESIFDVEIGQTLLGFEHVEAAADFMSRAQTEVHQRTAPIAQALIAGAHADPELDRYRQAFFASIDGQGRRVLGVFRDRGWLRTDIPFEEIVMTATVLSSVETYLRVVHQDGWTPERYRTWCQRTVAEAIFAAPRKL